MRAALAALVQSVFKIRPEELRRTALAFAYLFTAVGAFIVGRIARTVLFLEIPDYRDQLPLMYVLIAATVSLAMAAYARFEHRLRRDVTNAVTLAVIVVVTLGFRVALHTGRHWAYWAFYIWVEVYGSFVVVQFWAMASEIFNSRQAKRLFAVVGGGGVLANVVVGFGISGSVERLGTENLMFVVSALLAASLAAVLALGRESRTELSLAHERVPAARQRGGSGMFESRHVRLIAAVVMVVYVVSTLADYQFQVVVGDSIAGKDARSAFIAGFFGVTGVVAAVIQFFFVSRLLERFGILVALALLPLAMMTGSVALLAGALVPALWAVVATKGAENVLRYTVNDSTLQLFYLPLPGRIRSSVKTVIDGMLKPVAIGGTGIVMAVLVGQLEKVTGWHIGAHLGPRDLGWLVVAALAAWLLAIVQLRREYLASLLRTLRRRRLNFGDARFEVSDDATVRVLLARLDSTDEGEVLHALELARSVAPRARGIVRERVAPLLRHPAEEVRVAALEVLGASAEDAGGILELCEDESPAVRRAATLATCAILREQALGTVQPLLDDFAPEVRAAAVAGLIRHGGLDGVLASADTLKRMLSSPRASERAQAAWVLGEVGVHTFFQPLLPLFEDADDEVRLAAIAAAGNLRSPHLAGSLVRQLAHPRLATAAAGALAAYGPTAVELVADLLGDRRQEAAVRASACKVLARVADPRSVELLHRHLADDAPVRGAAIAALTTLVHHQPGIRVDRAAVRSAVGAEAAGAYGLLAVGEDLGVDGRTELLRDALAQRLGQALGRLFGLLALEYDADTIDVVRRNLHATAASTRANAVEVLDNLLGADEKALVVPLVEDGPVDKKLQQASAVLPLRRASRRQRLEELLGGNDEWLSVCAAAAVGAWRVNELEPAVRALLDSASPLCRETAMVALRELGELGLARRHVERLRGDPVPAVSRYAAHVLAEIA